ncbi:endonuclease [Moorena producens PAL-8-15-08-1]|uniref:Endonuclease n=1 Tax=Moorena producens PAL-8-15-08-1 TaxID=1458985 RepID=A0A1D8TT21_9CYAN|nr:endonuclease domain-containing protein [Moorena producens]AOX00811.1 endonuclease [Moorena producens PAL-8-15-08-1]
MCDNQQRQFHLPYNSKLVTRARELRKTMTPAERKLWSDYLKKFKFRVLRQRPIGNFIVDFYCAAFKLVIEVDGEYHSTQSAQVYDQERTQIIKGYGLKVIRFTNDEVLHNFEAVCDRISSEIPPSPP